MARKLGVMDGLPGLVFLGLAALPATLSAASGDTLADRVLGQGNLRASAPYFVNGRVFGATGIAFDRSVAPHRVYIADSEINRVLGWRDAFGFASGAPADLVIGGRGSRIPESRGLCAEPTAKRLCVDDGAGGLAVDRAGNLYVTDSGNHRVLLFDRPFDTDAVADRVFGQGGSFTSNACNKNGVSAASLCKPGALALDREDNLYVADLENARILYFRDPLHGDAKADRVFGQRDFKTRYFGADCHPPTATHLCLGQSNGHGSLESAADGLAVDEDGNLYVADGGHSRVLIFFDAARSDAVADRVLGGSFTGARGGTSDRLFGFLGGIALGPGGELYVADTSNSRVLELDHPLTSDVADRVFGQRDFTHGFVPFPPPSPSTLYSPYAVAVDEQGDLFVADTNHGRVVAYDQP